MNFEVWPGVPYPLGAHLDAGGVNFAVTSEHATGVTLCLFDPADPQRELARLPLTDVTNHVWHGYVPGLKAGALYGFRVDGPWAPDKGHYFNAGRLLVDPYARSVSGQLSWHEPLTAHVAGDKSFKRDERESGAGVPRSVVVDDSFDWSGETRPQVIWRKTILYEMHVKGFTARHPAIPENLRGTYAGLAHPAAIEHLTSLGVTSVELLPVHERVSEGFLGQRGLTNYWGYNTLSFFAPDQRFSASGTAGQQVREFKSMVKTLHAAGIEVILDVVFNHTCEGNHEGPCLSMRGLDAGGYYWLNEQGRHLDFTGCGNSLNLNSPVALKLAMDSLRYWVNEMHVDGFRFDLATTLARTRSTKFHGRRGAFFQSLHQDPVLSRVKLIAEPWDLGPEGYRVGQFPTLWAEWNDKYRSTVRRFWRGDPNQVPELGNRMSGSSDLYRQSGRRPTSSINYVACHDGFTLRDLVSYNHKHNELNAEENRDGTDENHSFNCGVEGETNDNLVNSLRLRQQKNFIATLFLSVGTPMLTAGDELSRTQLGNNNAYCQDNNLGYLDWEHGSAELLEFTRKCIALRKAQPVLQRRNFFLGETLEDSRFRDLVWFRPDGREMKPEDWQFAHARSLGWFLGGDAIATRNPKGQKVVGDSLLIFMNSADSSLEITLPDKSWGEAWELALSTADDAGAGHTRWFAPGEAFSLTGRSLICMRQAPKPS